MQGEKVWATAVAAAAMVVGFAASAAGVVSGQVSGGSGGFSIQVNYSCQGTPTCTGTYTSTHHDGSCPNAFTSSGNVTITGFDPSQPTSSGSYTLSNFQFNSGAAGTCSLTTTTATGNYTATSDGVNGSMTVTTTAPGHQTLTGGFGTGSTSTVRLSGTLAADDPDGSFVRLAFTCTGTPTCTGAYTFTEKDSGCSNTFSFGGTLILTGVDVSHAGSFSGNLTHYGNSNSNILSNGTCAYSIKDNSPHSITYGATWDGTNGTMVAHFVEGSDTFAVPGPFNVAGVAPPPSFPMTVTSNISATTANASAQVQPRPQDAGTTASTFVFAYAPQSLVGAGKRLPVAGNIPILLADGPDPCVLAQVNSSGQLVGASASTLTAATTGVLNAQGQTVNILNNVATPNVAGATMYVGYGANSTTMFANGTYQGAVNVPGPSQCTTNLATTATPASPGALTGLWWNANESGWGIHFTQRGGNVFAAWYTYDSAGKPKWYVSTCAGANGSSGTCNGAVYEVTGPNFFGGAFNPSLVNAASAGTLQISFSSANAASMTYTVAGQTRTNVPLTRQPLATGSADPAVNFSDIWWNSNESGWGAAMAQQFGITFLAWYVYDANGKPTWLVATCTMSGNIGAGTLYRTTGPAFGPSFDSSRVSASAAGTVTVEFTDPNNAIIKYTVDGVSGQKAVTRQIF